MTETADAEPDDWRDRVGYRGRVIVGVLNAVVAAGSPDGSDTGMVELRTSIDGICDAIAMLVAASGTDLTPKDRRETADLCRKRILVAANHVAQRVAAGEELPWTMDAIGPVH